jgi:hypothetical protein
MPASDRSAGKYLMEPHWERLCDSHTDMDGVEEFLKKYNVKNE